MRDKNRNETWKFFKLILSKAIDKFVPKKRCKKGAKKPMWYDRDVNRTHKNRLKWWRKYQETKRHEDYLSYKKALNKATKTIRQSKRKLEKKIAMNIRSDPKAFYKYSRSKLKSKETVGPFKDQDGNIVKDDNLVASMLNEYFSSVFTEEALCNLPNPRLLFQGSEPSVNISKEDICRRLENLNPEKSPGVDMIYPIVLKKLASVVCFPLSIVFQRSLETGIVPEDWKLANVTAIHKKGPKDIVSNYRPVNLTSQVCKVMEAIIRDSIVEHLKRHKLIKESQHGFTRGRSCLTNLLKFLEEVTRFVDKGCPVDIIYLDFSKAFDKVPHKHLLLKIRSLGIDEKISSWIEDWLADRKQRVVVRGCESAWLPVVSGVPQGSVLGPTLFFIYINDIEDGVTSKVLKFADDTKIYRSVQSIENIQDLQRDLKNLYAWSLEWQMLFNLDKCKCLHFGYNNQYNQYTLGDQNVKNESNEKDLGVIIKENLDVAEQVAEKVKIANKILGTINRIYDDKSKDNIVNLCKSLVRPHLEYAIQAWRPYKQKHIDALEKSKEELQG